MDRKWLAPTALLSIAVSAWTVSVRAQSAPTGTPPPDAKALVEAAKAPGEKPDLSAPLDGTTASLSAGGQLLTGNSRMLAGTLNGTYDSRYHSNGFGAALMGNYGQSGPPGAPVRETTENLQGRLRYDRYIIEQASLFMIATWRHDKFQGLDFRLNLDPGFKYLFLEAQSNSLWGEAGYDFQYDIRRDDSLTVLDANGNPVLDANGNPELLSKTATDHSTRLFAGFRHAFNKEVTLAAGLEYLQSVVDTSRYRINFDALFAAKVGGGLSLGLGFGARYDNVPLPGKQNLDTVTTLNLIYAYSDVPEPPKPPCPCPAPPTTAPDSAPEPASQPPASP